MNTNGFKTSKEKSNILGHQTYTNQNHLKIFLSGSQNGQMTAHTVKDAEKGDHLFFAGRCTVTMEICAVVLQKMGDPKEQVFSTHNT